MKIFLEHLIRQLERIQQLSLTHAQKDGAIQLIIREIFDFINEQRMNAAATQKLSEELPEESPVKSKDIEDLPF